MNRYPLNGRRKRELANAREKERKKRRKIRRGMILIECDQDFLDALEKMRKGEVGAGLHNLSTTQRRFLEAAIAADFLPLISLT